MNFNTANAHAIPRSADPSVGARQLRLTALALETAAQRLSRGAGALPSGVSAPPAPEAHLPAWEAVNQYAARCCAAAAEMAATEMAALRRRHVVEALQCAAAVVRGMAWFVDCSIAVADPACVVQDRLVWTLVRRDARQRTASAARILRQMAACLGADQDCADLNAALDELGAFVCAALGE